LDDALELSEGYLGDAGTGANIYSYLGDALGSAKDASEFLSRAGIPGNNILTDKAVEKTMVHLTM